MKLYPFSRKTRERHWYREDLNCSVCLCKMLQLYSDFVGYKTNEITQLLYVQTSPALNESNNSDNNNGKRGSSLNCIIELH